MNEAIKQQLILLAQKYETPSFIQDDPSQFLYWYPKNQQKDIEIASFIAAMLSFGSRSQFIPKIKQILTLGDQKSGSISHWIQKGAPDFPHGPQKFYRFYSYDDMHTFFSELSQILSKNETLGEYFHHQAGEESPSLQSPHSVPVFSANPSSGHIPQRPLSEVISNAFPESKIVPKGKNSANKRIHMFLRWMVRTNSPVDLGLWTWYSPAKLILPLDVHVLQESINLGLLSPTEKATRKTAEKLTKIMSCVFPQDPVRGDFALFGLGVDN